MNEAVRCHYERYPYPHFPLLASVRRSETYALNLTALWSKFNGTLPPASARRILVAGCGSFSPYPFSVANESSEITALDLSAKSLVRARLHCLLHGRRNLRYAVGDLLDASAAPGPFGLIDAFGVLHHLDDPLSGLRALAARLAPGGVLRLMLYSRYARREEESIRRAFRLLGITSPVQAKKIIRRAPKASRLRAFIEASDEAGFESGLADALLHPCVHTFRIGEVLELVRQSGLELLRFAHHGTLGSVDDEVERIRALEAGRQSCGNYLIYLGRDTAGACPDADGGRIMLNPCLKGVVGPLQIGMRQVPPRLGFKNPLLGWRERRFLSSFLKPVSLNSLDPEHLAAVRVYKEALFLLQYRE